MSNKVKIELIADTSKAEKSILKTINGVKKAEREANKRGDSVKGYDKNGKPITSTTIKKSDNLQNITNALKDSLGGLSSSLDNAIAGVDTFFEKLTIGGLVLDKFVNYQKKIEDDFRKVAKEAALKEGHEFEERSEVYTYDDFKHTLKGVIFRTPAGNSYKNLRQLSGEKDINGIDISTKHTRLDGLIGLIKNSSIGSKISSAMGLLGTGGTVALGTAGLGVGAAAGLGMYVNSKVKQGRQKADEFDNINASLSILNKNLNKGIGDTDELAKQIQTLGINGLVPVDSLTKGVKMLMLAFKGNQTEASKWIDILADMSAGTGESVEHFAELITKANQFGSIEFEVFKQLNEKGIPILESLAKALEVNIEKATELAKEGKVSAEEFQKAFEIAHKTTYQNALNESANTASLVAKQTAQYQDVEASYYTKGYDSAKLPWEKEKRDLAKAESEDINEQLQAEVLGDALGELSVIVDKVTYSIGEALKWIPGVVATGFGLIENRAQNKLRRIGTDNKGLKELIKNKDATVGQLDTARHNLKGNIEFLKAVSENGDLSPHTRKLASELLEPSNSSLSDLEKAIDAAKKRDKEKAKQEKASKLRAKYSYIGKKQQMLESDVYLAEHNLDYQTLTSKYGLLHDKVKNDTASDDEIIDFNKLKPIFDEWQKLIKEEAEAASKQKKEEEEKEKRAQEEKAEREKRLAEEQALRDEFLAEHNARNDEIEQFKLETNKLYSDLAKLGFDRATADGIVGDIQLDTIKERKKKIDDINKSIAATKEDIKTASMSRMGMETNAWSSTGNVYTVFGEDTTLLKEQLKELRESKEVQNKQLTAIKELSVNPVAM